MPIIGKIIRVNTLPTIDKRESNVIYQVAAPGSPTYTDYAVDENGDLKTHAVVETTLLNSFNEAVSKINSILKGEATLGSSPTPYNPTDYPNGLYEKWEARTAGVYTNFKDGGTPPQPIEVTATDLEEKLVFINVSNGIAKKDPVSIPGAAIDNSFELSNTNKAQNAHNINNWLVNTVKGGSSDEAKETTEEVGDVYKNIGVELSGSSADGLQSGLYQVKTNSNSILDASKFLTKAAINLSIPGTFKFCIGSWNGSKFVIRWESEEKSGVVGWNTFDFVEKVNPGEIPAVLCIASTTAQIRFGFNGSTSNRFIQYSTTADKAEGSAGSYYSLYFELKNIKLIELPTEGTFNLSKSVSKIVDDFSQNGYVGISVIKGESNVNSDSNAGEGYAINKLDLNSSYILEKLEINTITAGAYNIAVGFLDQYKKFIEKKIITKTLAAGLNVLTFDKLILEKGDYIGLKNPGKLPVNNSPEEPNLWTSNGYLNPLSSVTGKALPIKLYLKEYIDTPIATKADIADANGKIEGLQQNFILNGKPVNLVFNIDGTVNWKLIEGYDSILVIGNSLTLHPITSYWWGLYGMAASKRENDYAHRILAKMQVYKPSAVMKAITIASWENNPTGFDKSQLDADLVGRKFISIRVGENATFANIQGYFGELVDYIISKAPTAKIVIGGVFWTDANKDAAMKAVADARNIPFIKMADLNIAENRSAIGNQVMGDDGQLHTVNDSGVAGHPGDLGHERIATAFMSAIGL